MTEGDVRRLRDEAMRLVHLLDLLATAPLHSTYAQSVLVNVSQTAKQVSEDALKLRGVGTGTNYIGIGGLGGNPYE